MKQIAEIIQGSEQTLFNRVLFFLQRAGVSKRWIGEYERHQNDNMDELIDVSYYFLEAAGYYL